MHRFVNGDVSGEDQGFLRELAEALAEAGTAPPEAVAVARETFTWRTIDADLAKLAHDSQSARARSRPCARPRR